MFNLSNLSPNGKYGWLLMASYLYYHEPCYDPIMTDHQYDALCKELLACWDEVTHRNKDLITLENLSSGSFYNVERVMYPRRLIEIAQLISKGSFIPEEVKC